MYNHHKRMLPKRDDGYRTEFPGNFYSSSSVYSYSPTSASDCPEHGRSRRRTTLILVTSVILATLGVLSIAGIAAYLGIISKNISNSQYEESYLQSNTSTILNLGSSSSEEEDILYNHGRSKDDSGFIDLTNSLSDTKTELDENSEDNTDLVDAFDQSDQKITIDSFRQKDTQIIVTKPPEIVKGTKINNTAGSPSSSRPIHISAKPVTVVVKSTTSSQSSKEGIITHINPNSNEHENPTVSNIYNPVDMISPPTRNMENVVSFFTEESTSSVKSYTKTPLRNNRIRNRYPITNSHSLNPSTTTQINRNSEELFETDQLSYNTPADEIVTQSPTDDKQKTTIKTSSHAGSAGIDRNRETQDIVHVSPSDAKKSQQKSNTGSSYLGADKSHNSDSDDDFSQNGFAKRHGLTDEPNLHHGNKKNTQNVDDPQKTTHLHSSNHRDNHDNPSDFDFAAKREGVSHKSGNFRPIQEPSMPSTSPGYFVPIVPIISSEREADPGLINNHKMHLTFDRISPEFYDKNPWTPSLGRPNMEKLPKVDINNDFQNPTTTQPHPIIVWNTEYSHDDNSTPKPLNNYYGYGHTAPASGGNNDHDYKSGNEQMNDYKIKPNSEFDDNRAISQGSGTFSSTAKSNIRSEQATDSLVNVNNTKNASQPDSNVEETTGGFRPVSIPAYTLIIPHIPNSPANSNSQSQIKTSFSNETTSSEEIDNESFESMEAYDQTVEDRNLNTSYKSDRLGLLSDDVKVAVSAEKHDHVNASKKQKHYNDHVDEKTIKNLAEDIKEDDYMDVDEDGLTADNPSPTKIYKLDPDNVDIVPDSFASPPNQIESQDLKKHFPSTSDTVFASLGNNTTNKSAIHHEENTTPRDPDPIMKTTTDLIMSTLGSLNLIKSHPPKEFVQMPLIESKLRKSDVMSSIETDIRETEKEKESPLFPPVRSYVSVNLPLRPKPSDEDEHMEQSKNMRMAEEEGGIPILRPDLTTASSLQKVLSMMMKFEGDESSRQFSDDHASIVNISTQNVSLILTNVNGSLVLNNATPIPDNNPLSHTTHREQKSYRDAKIDDQFNPPSSVEHVPVPLIVTESPKVSEKPSKLKLSSVKINDANSPVYKFVLRQGQSIEDLLKEIFQNYTETEVQSIGSGNSRPRPRPTSLVRDKTKLSHTSFPSPQVKSLDESSETKRYFTDQTTERESGILFSNVKINHHVETTPVIRPLLPMQVSTSDPPILQTVTSIVINENDEMVEECPRNSSFRCVSTGKCIPSYLRCNYIKECPDNSDEANCSCADFLKANGNGRKLCDSIVDCNDASDEYTYCDYCQPGQYICAGSRSCINRTQICDSKRDCPNGDDENECVKIGKGGIVGENELEEFKSMYNKNGQLMVRKKGVWGKLCVETFSSVVSHWEVKDLARAVCKALTFSDFESVQRIEDNSINSTEPYYELFYGLSSNETGESGDNSSSESTPRMGLGFKKTECKSKLVVNVTCQDLQCGTAPKSLTQTARIVGGANSMPGKWPWQAALYKNGEYQCGATLISSRWLLSAGHCFYNAQDDYWVVRLGTLRRGATILSPYEQVVRITHIFLHPQYQNVGFVNDVSLLRLEHEVNFTDYVRPVCLPSRETKIRDGRMCTVVGWGQLFEVGRVFPDTLQEVQLPLISTAECRKRTLFLPLYKLTDQMFCAGFDRGGRDACLGDSGGPMMCQETDGRWSLYGVTSNGYGCARANRPGVYTKVASYLDWIYEKMNLDSSFVYRDKAKPCPGHRCLLGECLDKRQVCNGIVNCIEDNGSDERGPNCTLPGLIT